MRGKILLGHAVLGESVVVGRERVTYLRKRQVEGFVEDLQSGEAAGHDARAVIAAVARDDLLFLLPAEDVVVVPDELYLRLVGVGPGHAVINLAHAFRRHLQHFLG